MGFEIGMGKDEDKVLLAKLVISLEKIADKLDMIERNMRK